MCFLQANLLQGPKQQIRTNERNEKKKKKTNTTSEGFILKHGHQMTKQTYQEKQIRPMSNPGLDIVSNNTPSYLAWCGKCLRCRDNRRI